jgi:hypothetical protein
MDRRAHISEPSRGAMRSLYILKEPAALGQHLAFGSLFWSDMAMARAAPPFIIAPAGSRSSVARPLNRD